jgi:hypothetical protein
VIYFARTRHEYPSYSDLWRLVELSDFPLIYVDEIDISRTAVYIFTPMNGEVFELLDRIRDQPRRAKLIWWFLERLDSTPMLEDGSFERLRPQVDEVWVSDRWEAAQHPGFRYVCLASHPGLGNDPLPSHYDFTHQSYVHGRRIAIMNELAKKSLREGPCAWGAERDQVLRTSKLMLHVHQYHLALYTPLRFALAAAYAMPLISERLFDPFPLEGVIEQAGYGEIVDRVVSVARDPGDRGTRLYQALCLDRTFREEVEQAL